jgi:hypothetical protein
MSFVIVYILSQLIDSLIKSVGPDTHRLINSVRSEVILLREKRCVVPTSIYGKEFQANIIKLATPF